MSPPCLCPATPRYVDNVLGIFYSLRDEDAYRREVHYSARAWKARGVDELAQFMIASGNPGVYAYRWDWDEEPSALGYDLSVALGAAHALEIALRLQRLRRRNRRLGLHLSKRRKPGGACRGA